MSGSRAKVQTVTERSGWLNRHDEGRRWTKVFVVSCAVAQARHWQHTHVSTAGNGCPVQMARSRRLGCVQDVQGSPQTARDPRSQESTVFGRFASQPFKRSVLTHFALQLSHGCVCHACSCPCAASPRSHHLCVPGQASKGETKPVCTASLPSHATMAMKVLHFQQFITSSYLLAPPIAPPGAAYGLERIS